jgi:hypothetical protein
MKDGILVISNPEDVAAADQAAAALGRGTEIWLTTWVEPGTAYVIDSEKSDADLYEEINRLFGEDGDGPMHDSAD